MGSKAVFGGGHRLGEGQARNAQEEEEFAGPEQNIEQTAALKIGQVSGLQADVEGLAGTFFDESAHSREIDRFGGEFAAAGIKAFEPFITAQQEMVQAESFAIQCCNRGAATRTHRAVSLPMQRIHSTQAHWFNPTSSLILLETALPTIRCAMPHKRFHLRKCDRAL